MHNLSVWLLVYNKPAFVLFNLIDSSGLSLTLYSIDCCSNQSLKMNSEDTSFSVSIKIHLVVY